MRVRRRTVAAAAAYVAASLAGMLVVLNLDSAWTNSDVGAAASFAFLMLAPLVLAVLVSTRATIGGREAAREAVVALVVGLAALALVVYPWSLAFPTGCWMGNCKHLTTWLPAHLVPIHFLLSPITFLIAIALGASIGRWRLHQVAHAASGDSRG